MTEPILTFSVAGVPVPKGRPRFRIVKPRGRPQFVTVYSPSETVKYEARVADAARVAMSGCAPLENALAVIVESFLPIPASWSSKDREAAIAFDLMPTGKPDGDNFLKAALDACNKIVFRDDGQIVRATVQKAYSETPRLVVSVWGWDDE